MQQEIEFRWGRKNLTAIVEIGYEPIENELCGSCGKKEGYISIELVQAVGEVRDDAGTYTRITEKMKRHIRAEADLQWQLKPLCNVCREREGRLEALTYLERELYG